jgi:hypothetical protein
VHLVTPRKRLQDAACAWMVNRSIVAWGTQAPLLQVHMVGERAQWPPANQA